MNLTENPISTLHECIAHAQYQGFSDIQYQKRDWAQYRETGEDIRTGARRRPTTSDFEVHSMFPQTWGSTALGHGGIGGAAMTTAYTVVLDCALTGEYLVYFGGRFCYKVPYQSKNVRVFLEDCAQQVLQDRSSSGKYL